MCGWKEKERNSMKAPCGDLYCGGSVNDLFERAAEFEFHFRPKFCGQNIPIENTELFLSWHIYKKFQKRSEEFSRQIEPTVLIVSVEPSFHERQSMTIKQTALLARS